MIFKEIIQYMQLRDLIFEANGLPQDARIKVNGQEIDGIAIIYNVVENAVEISFSKNRNRVDDNT
jgi:hypothetical protein